VPDHARSTDAAVQAQLDRLWALSPRTDVLGLERITHLLARLGDPHHHLPPAFHVAGTNGKGSTCAFLRAGLEAAGYRVHVYTSPHLVRFNERIRISGRLIDDPALAALLSEVLDQAGDIGASFFEVTTAAAFLAFARTPADACIVEVGLGGRLDATNVIPAPVACGIAQLGIDHQAFLGSDPVGIAREKAGIARPNVPLVTLAYPAEIGRAVTEIAEQAGAPVLAQSNDWHIDASGTILTYRDAHGTLALSHPALHGPYQADNLGLATAMLRHQHALAVPAQAYEAMPGDTRWPARMQRLDDTGPLVRRLPAERRRHGVWLDGAHNPAAAAAIAGQWGECAPTTLVIGMLANKDAAAILSALVTPACAVVAVPVPGHDHHPPAALAAQARSLGARDATTAASIETAIDIVADDALARSVLIAGSLYLAGDVLAANDEYPD
jgi:dihydrofolate synthase/folylpolyglutamate synthase